MSGKPWMPLYIADYLADTAHLRALQSGAYLHLIMHYWVTGALPDDDSQLAAIAKLTPEEWAANRPVLQAFFEHGWKHKRVEAELKRCESISAENRAKASKAAKTRWDRKRPDAPSIAPSNAWSTAQAMLQNAQSQSQSQSHGGGGERATLGALPVASSSSISEQAFTLSRTIAKLCGHDEAFIPPAWAGAPLTVQGWLNNGWTAEQIEPACREIMAGSDDPPAKITYFEKGIARFVARLAKPLPTAPSTGGHHGRKLTPRQQKLADLHALVEQRRRDLARDLTRDIGVGQSDGHQHAGS
jgi:uncharacterized protein YdaU (DUF1376 family)